MNKKLNYSINYMPRWLNEPSMVYSMKILLAGKTINT